MGTQQWAQRGWGLNTRISTFWHCSTQCFQSACSDEWQMLACSCRLQAAVCSCSCCSIARTSCSCCVPLSHVASHVPYHSRSALSCYQSLPSIQAIWNASFNITVVENNSLDWQTGKHVNKPADKTKTNSIHPALCADYSLHAMSVSSTASSQNSASVKVSERHSLGQNNATQNMRNVADGARSRKL